MAVTIVTYCDVHLERGENVPGAPMRVLAGGSDAPEIVDLCDDCADDLLRDLRVVIAKHGRPDDELLPPPTGVLPLAKKVNGNSTGVDESPVDCHLCNGRYMRRSILRSHLKDSHDVILSEYETTLGHTVDGVPLIAACPDCGTGFPSVQGMGAHRRYAHGIEGTSPASVSARKARADAEHRGNGGDDAA